MKAAIRRKYCSPEFLKIETVDKPTPKADQVLIKVYATTVNRTDYAVLTGKPYVMRFFTGLSKPNLISPGTDFAGVVEGIGEEVNSFEVGDKVFGFYDEGLGSQAEYMVYSEKESIVKMPDNVSFEVAVAGLEGGHYAINFINKIKLQAGQKILVNGSTGAIGSALLQLLKYNDIYVTAVCNTKNIELIKSLGADKIYDYLTEDFTKDEEIYDCVLDAVGKSSFGKCKPLLKEGGIYISSELGSWAENPFLALWTPLFGKKRVIFPIPVDTKGSLLFIKKLLEEGKYHPVIDRTYPLEEISEAYKYVATGQKTGNVVIKIC